MEIITMGCIGAVLGFVVYGGGYWVEHKIADLEKQQQAKRQEEDKRKLAPSVSIELKGCPACQGSYKPPLFRHMVIIQNRNYESVPVLDMKLEFKFKHVVAETKKQIWLPKEGVKPNGELEISGLEIYQTNNDGTTYEYQTNEITGLEDDFTFKVNTVTINKEIKNINTVFFSVAKWSDQKAAFAGDVITNESLQLYSPKSVGKYHSVSGKYYYEVNGVRYSQNVNHDFIPKTKNP